MLTLTHEHVVDLENAHTSGFYAKRELVLVRGRGAIVWSADGRAYLDCSAGYGVANVGHSHPVVVQAIQHQAAQLLSCPEFVYNDVRAQFQAALAAHLPAGLERIFLCNSGAEANEAALKMARLSTARPHLIATVRGFHGRTLGALAATWNPAYRQPFEPLLPPVSHVPFNNVAAVRQAITPETGAILVEPVQGEGGVRPADPGYLAGLRQLADEHDLLLIFDEVQTGFGRTGTLFACQQDGVVPDLLVMGKALGGGVPMGGVALGPRVQNIAPGLHGSTFGGNPLACAAGLASLQVLMAEGLVAGAAERGRALQEQVRQLASPLVREVRGRGLMVGVELKVRVLPLLQALQEKHGIIALPAGPTVLRLLPPLVITPAEVDAVVAGIQAVLADL